MQTLRAGRFVVSIVVLAVAAGCGGATCPPPAAPDPRVNDLDRRVTKLETRPAATWSCAAQCVTEYHCTTNGESNVIYHHVESTGATALEAFNRLRGACPKNDDLEVSTQCLSGHVQEIDATIVNACVRD